MKKIIIKCYLLLFIYSFSINAQISIPDSIHTDYEKSVFFQSLARSNSNIDSSLFYIEKSIIYAQNSKNDSLIALLYYLRGEYAYMNGNYSKAISYMKKLKDFALEKKNKIALFKCYSLLGKVYSMNGDPNLGLKQNIKALNLILEVQDSSRIGDAYNNIGDAYKAMKLNEKAKKYFLLALDIYNKTNVDESEKEVTYNNLARCSDSFEEINYYLDKSLKIRKAENNFPKLAIFYFTKGDALNMKMFYPEALHAFENAYRISDSISYDVMTKLSLNGMGQVLNSLGRYKEAIFYLEKALSFKKFNLDNHNILLSSLADAYQANKDYKKAFLISVEMLEINDSIHSNQSKATFAEFDAKYESEIKDKEILKQKLKVELEKKKRNRIIFGSIALLLLVILIYQWIANRQKRRNKETELALKLKKAESKNLKELNNAKSRFFANITHEFRTPLTLIMGPLQDVIGKIKGENKETLKIAHSNSKKLLTLVNDILDLSTVEEGSPELNKSETCILSFLKRIFYSYESYAKIRQIETEIVIPEGNDVLVNIDLEKLEKIINNLMSNAFKYTEAGGSVKLLVDIKKDTVFIAVKDSGVGIDEKDIKHIFERYYQGQNSENITGTGIGLSFADRLAKMMGGSISVESKRNEGSTFTLQIPLDLSKECPEDIVVSNNIDPLVDTEKSNYKVNTIFADKPRVLIVEDNYEMQKYLSGILKEYFHIDLAENGFEGLKKLKENKYDLVSSDVMMPGMDGFVFRQEMNKNLEWRNIPFMLLTARSLKEDRIRGFKLGVDDYITKPFNATEYIARINNLIKNKQERDKWINDKMEDINLTLEKNNDNDMIKELERIIVENIDDPEFKVTKLATMSNCSPRNLSRMTKKLIGLTPVNLILEVRLQKAYQLLKSNKYKTVSEVRYEVGIDNASYFTKKFVERFGLKPGDVT